MGAGSNSNEWKMFLLFGEFFMLFNDKKLTMYTSSKKRLDFKFIPCISLHRLSTENSRYIYWKYHFTGKKKKTYRISGNHAYVVSFHGPNCNMPQHCCMRGSSLSSMFEKPGLKFNLFIFMLWFKCSIGLKFFKKARFLLSFALDGFINWT